MRLENMALYSINTWVKGGDGSPDYGQTDTVNTHRYGIWWSKLKPLWPPTGMGKIYTYIL